MRALVLAVFAVLTGFGIASAGEVEKKIEIKVVKSGDGDDKTVHWVGDGADIDDLEVGESRTLDDGVVVTRAEDGLTIEVEGESIDIPHPDNHSTLVAYAGDGQMTEDIDVRVMKMREGSHADTHAVRLHDAHKGIMIASPEEIDETTRETIRSVLASAGYDEEVSFVNPGERHVKVIKERVEKTD